MKWSYDDFLTWEIYIESSMRYISLVFPLFCCLATLGFYEEIHTNFSYCLVRTSNYRKKLFGTGIAYSLIGGLSVAVPLTVIITMLNYLLVPSLKGIGGLSEIFPEFFFIITRIWFFCS